MNRLGKTLVAAAFGILAANQSRAGTIVDRNVEYTGPTTELLTSQAIRSGSFDWAWDNASFDGGNVSVEGNRGWFVSGPWNYHPDGTIDWDQYAFEDTGTITVSLDTPQSYFGALIGSGFVPNADGTTDTVNTATFYSGDTRLYTMDLSRTGVAVTRNPTQGYNDAQYVNLNFLDGATYDRVVLSDFGGEVRLASLQFAATPQRLTAGLDSTTDVPEPGLVALAALGLAGLAAARRRSA